MRDQISKKEYARLVSNVAQRQAGVGEAPSAKLHRQAEKDSQDAMVRRGVSVKGGTTSVERLHDKVRERLSGVTGMGGDEVGSFWSSFKDSLSTAAKSPIIPFLGPAAGLTAATAAVVSTRPPKRSAPTAAPAAAPSAPSSQSDDERVSSLGGSGRWGQSVSSAYESALARLSGDDDVEYIFGDSGDLNDEDAIIYGEGGGSSELGASRRRTGGDRRWSSFAGSSLTPDVYRAGVMQRAIRLAGGGQPTTKNLFDAQTQVDMALARAGAKVRIPGAQPGRVTR